MARIGDNPVWQDIWSCRGLNEDEINLGVLTFNTYADAKAAADNIHKNKYSDKFKFIEIVVKKDLHEGTFKPVKITSLNEATDEDTFIVKSIYSGINEEVNTKEEVEIKAQEYMDKCRLENDFGVVYRQYKSETFGDNVLWEPVTE